MPPELDPITARIDAARRWGRFGGPNGIVRPVLRKPGNNPKAGWSVEVWGNRDEIDVQMERFGDSYGVSPAAPGSEVENHLVGLTKGGDQT